mmetsp:Transcript_36274/g.112245  ORF Transcript_36274/g.112245 Transcript_36274/m.112245 type:complete len:232 (-) Transcript_36274:1720-2415(-)
MTFFFRTILESAWSFVAFLIRQKSIVSLRYSTVSCGEPRFACFLMGTPIANTRFTIWSFKSAGRPPVVVSSSSKILDTGATSAGASGLANRSVSGHFADRSRCMTCSCESDDAGYAWTTSNTESGSNWSRPFFIERAFLSTECTNVSSEHECFLRTTGSDGPSASVNFTSYCSAPPSCTMRSPSSTMNGAPADACSTSPSAVAKISCACFMTRTLSSLKAYAFFDRHMRCV